MIASILREFLKHCIQRVNVVSVSLSIDATHELISEGVLGINGSMTVKTAENVNKLYQKNYI